MFNFNLAAIPSIPTRKALLIIDLQNDFIGPDAALPVVEPDGFVSRTLDLVRAFRDSGAGDVIWVRSEFERHISLTTEGDQIITSDIPQRPPMTSRMSARGRQPSSKLHDGALMELDDESFLSVSQNSEKPSCVRKGTPGAEFPKEVQEAIDSRDIVFKKYHYSAFAQQELVQMLRGRLVTEMYVCGSLTNIGIYATALDAGRHGYEMTLVEDCCGYRNEIRHVNAVRQLMQLVGSEAMTSESVIEKLQPSKPKVTEIPKPPQPKTTPPKSEAEGTADSGSRQGRESGTSKGEKGVTTNQKSPVRPQEPLVPSSKSTPTSTGLSPSLSKVSLSRSDESPAAIPSPHPTEERVSTATGQVQEQRQSESPGAKGEVQTLVKESPTASTTETKLSRPSFWVDNSAPLEADSDPGSDTSSPELDNVILRESRYRGSAAAEMRSRMSRGPGGVHHVRPSGQSSGGTGGTSYSTRSGQVAAVTTATKRPASGSPSNSPAAPERTTTRIAIRTRRHARDSSSNDTPESSPNKQDKTLATQPFSSSSSSSSASPSPAVTRPEEPVQPDPTSNPTKMAEQKQQLPPIITKPICEGDTTIILNALSPTLSSTAFEALLKEVNWAGMSRMGGEVPRRIAVQGEVDAQGNMPVYRHPADESPPLYPFTPTVIAIKTEIEKLLGHPLNHVLIQHYRSGNDYISEHSDKTLDIVPGSFIANVSLGAERTMVFRTKRPSKHTTTSNEKDSSNGPARQIERAPLPHNSLCKMGLQTNKRWLHAIRQDKRLDKEKSPAELSHNGERISLTFRQIGTFLDKTQTKIWGQGAVSKSRDSPGCVINGQEHEETVLLLKAFGAENNDPLFDWGDKYGGGFNVLHMGSPKRFFAGSNRILNMRVRIALLEMGIGCAGGSVEGDIVRFEDNDPDRAVVYDSGDGSGGGNLLRYLDAVYGVGRRYDQIFAAEVARRFMRLQGGLDFWGVWKGAMSEVGVVDGDGTGTGSGSEEEKRGLILKKLGKVKEFKAALEQWEGFAREAAIAVAGAGKNTKTANIAGSGSLTSKDGEASGDGNGDGVFYIAGGDKPSPADFALWPVLEDIVRVCGLGVFELAQSQSASQSVGDKAPGQSQSKKSAAGSSSGQKEKSTTSSSHGESGDIGGAAADGGYLARYYKTFGARSTVRKVVEAESQGQGQTQGVVSKA